MTNRGTFLAALAGLAAAGASAPATRIALARSATTLHELLAAIPPVRSGTWVQYVLGAGEPYAKKIGYGHELTSRGNSAFIETEIGDAGGTCNPNTVKKAYLRAPSYGDLLAPHDVSTYVMKAGTTYMGLDAGRADRLWLLDRDDLYTTRTAALTERGTERVAIGRRRFSAQRVDLAFGDEPHGLREMTLWLTPDVPCGVARLHAVTASGPPFDLRIDVFGDRYTSQIDATLDSVTR